MRAAFHKVDITPKEPCYMAGYSREKKSQGILDPIQINTMVIEVTENDYFVLTVLDSIILEKSFCQQVKQQIGGKFGIPETNIIVSCIHTHSAPAYFKLTFEDTKVEKELTEEAERVMVNSISQAFARLEECTIAAYKLQIDGLYGNRNQKDAYSDKNIYMLDFLNKRNQLIGCFMNISSHPTILNGQNHLLSADLIGWVRMRLEERKKAAIVVTNGACGDVSTRFYRKAAGDNELAETAQAIAEQVMEKQKSFPLCLNWMKTGQVSYMAHFDALNDEFNQKAYIELEEKIKMADGQEKQYVQFLLSRLQKKISDSPYDMELYSQIYCFGNFILVALPGDVVSELGRRIKDAFLEYEVILICYSNTYTNYLVDNSNYGKYFETYNSRLAKGEADIFIARTIDAIRQLV